MTFLKGNSKITKNYANLLAKSAKITAWGLALALSTQAMAKNVDLINKITRMSDQDVLNQLLNGGVGQCKMGDAKNCSQCACDYYFTGGYVTTWGGQNYNGYPIYNSDNNYHSYYNGSGSATDRAHPASPISPQASTGCIYLRGSGYSASNVGPSGWGGRNTDEGNMSLAQLSKKLLLAALNDQTDVCGSSSVAAFKAGNAFSSEQLLNSNKVVFASATNKEQCWMASSGKILLSGTSTVGYVPQRKDLCQSVARRLTAQGISLPLKNSVAQASFDLGLAMQNGQLMVAIKDARATEFAAATSVKTIDLAPAIANCFDSQNKFSATQVCYNQLNQLPPEYASVAQLQGKTAFAALPTQVAVPVNYVQKPADQLNIDSAKISQQQQQERF